MVVPWQKLNPGGPHVSKEQPKSDSGGGTTRQEKEYHYEKQIEAWNDYDTYGISP